MSLEPHFQPKPKRLPERKAVTVCIAGIQYNEKREPLIMSASDRRVSIFGGWFSDDTKIKFGSLSPNWMVMLAGSPEQTKIIIDGMPPAFEKADNSLDEIVKAAQAVYTERRRLLIETVVLPEFDISSYAEYKSLKHTDELMFNVITEKIHSQQEDWHLLFAGFDKNRVAHLFVLSGEGQAEYCDYQGVAAIGTGAWAALLWLSYYGYKKGMEVGQAGFGIVSAKFFAERAQEVGDKTILTIMKPDQDFALVLSDGDLGGAREAWKSIYIKPKSATDELEQTISGHLAMYESFRP